MSPQRSSASANNEPANSGFGAWRFGGLLTLLFAIFFAPVLLGWEAFSFIDAGFFGYPLAYYLRESIWSGELPLWNPLNNCGTPFLAQWNTMVLYPPSLFYVLFPIPWSYSVFCVGHLVFAGIGMYILARRWTGNELAAAVAGVVFAFNGLTWWGLMWPSIISALAWMPWLVLTMEDAWQRGSAALVRAALVGAMQMLTGGTEVILQTWFFIGVLAAVAAFRKDVPWAKLVSRGLAVGLLVFGLAAAQLLPFLDLLANSQRSGTYGDARIAAMAPTGWANYLVPLFRHCRNVQGVFAPPTVTWTGSYYLGVGTILLAVYALWRNRGPRVWLLSGITLFSLVMALGNAGLVYEWVQRLLPLLGFIRFPVKFVMLATFALPLLAAFGLARWQGVSASGTGERRPMVALGAVLAFLMGIIVLVAWKWPLPDDEFPAMAMSAITRVLILSVFVAVLGLLPKPGKWHRALQLAVPVLLWMDVYTHGSNLSPTVPAPALEPNAIRQFFGWENTLAPGTSRAMLSRNALGKMLTAGSPDPVGDAQARRLALYMNFNLLDGIPKVDGLFPMELRNYRGIKVIPFAPEEPTALIDFLAVSHVSSPTNAVQWVERDSFLPMITAGQKPEFASDGEIFNRIFSPAFSPAREVFLPAEARSAIGERGTTTARIVSIRFSAHKVRVEYEAETDTVLVVAQMFYHRWKAYLDGKETPIWKANRGFQAVAIPGGRHRVELVYRDSMFFAGAAVSAACWAGCIFALWWWKRSDTRREGSRSKER